MSLPFLRIRTEAANALIDEYNDVLTGRPR
jgi:hypothetical protein